MNNSVEEDNSQDLISEESMEIEKSLSDWVDRMRKGIQEKGGGLQTPKNLEFEIRDEMLDLGCSVQQTPRVRQKAKIIFSKPESVRSLQHLPSRKSIIIQEDEENNFSFVDRPSSEF